MVEKETLWEKEVVYVPLDLGEQGFGPLGKGDKELEGKGVTSLTKKEIEDKNVNPQEQMVKG